MEYKEFWKSKTFLINLIMPILLFVARDFPTITVFITENFVVSGAIWGIINVAVRAITKQTIAWRL